MSSFQARQLLPSFLLLLWLQKLPAASLSSSCLLLLFLPLLLLLFVFVGTNQSVSWAAGDYQYAYFATSSKDHKNKKETNTTKNTPKGFATEILIPCISLTIDEHSRFHSLFRCAKFEFCTVGRTKVINVQSTPCSKSGFVFFFVVLFFLCGFLTWWWWQNRHAYNPRQPMLYLIKSTMYFLSSLLRFTSIFVIKSTEVKDQLFDLVANYQLLASLRNQQYLLQCPSSFSFEWLLFL